MKLTGIPLLIFISCLLCGSVYPQNWFSLPTWWEVTVKGGIYNIETADVNRDGHPDIISGNFNDTYVWFGGAALLDSTVDLVYKGRCLAITDFNGDGIPDMITMHFTSYDSARWDYNGDLLFYYGKKTGQYLFDTVPDYSIPLPTLYPTLEQFSMGTFKPGIRTGDLNHDGKMDLIFSSNTWPGRGILVGKLYIYLGKDIPSNSPDFNIEPNWPRGYNFGEYFEVGDINGDGYDDLLISQQVLSPHAPTFDSLAILYLYYGGPNQTYDINNPSFLYKSYTNSNTRAANWFLNRFSLDDINCDGYKDLVVWREDYKPDSVTAVHFGKPGYNGFDTIPDLKLKNWDPETKTSLGGGVSQNIGDYNSDGYDDFIFNGAGETFYLMLGGPHISNNNPYGVRGDHDADQEFPYKAVSAGDQSGYGRNDFIGCIYSDEIGWGHILMFIGDPWIKTGVRQEKDSLNNAENIITVFPNPFNSQTTIKYSLRKSGNVNLKLYNSIGQEIMQLKNEFETAGSHEIKFTNDKLPSGIYFLTLNDEGKTTTQKLVLTK